MAARRPIVSLVSSALALCGALCLASGAKAQARDVSHGPDGHTTPPGPVLTYTNDRPPEPRIAARPPMPFPHAVWVEGYWDWTGQRYVWREGRWTAPHPGMTWRSAHWQPFGDGWVLVPGQWVD